MRWFVIYSQGQCNPATERKTAMPSALKLCMLAILAIASLRSLSAQTETILYTFTEAGGVHPTSGLISDGQGNFYGTASGSSGLVFKVDDAGSFSSLNSILAPSEIGVAVSPLTLDSQGNLYGNVFGDLPPSLRQTFQVSPAGSYKVLSTTGGLPAGVVLDAQGNVYGPSCIVQANQPTVCSLIKITPSGTVSTLHTFPKNATLLGLTNDAGGNFYSTLENGGAGQNPVFAIYKTTPTGQTTLLKTFVDLHNVTFPSFLTVGANGNLYGMTGDGGPTHNGTIFKLTPAGKLTTLFNFNGTNGSFGFSDSGCTTELQEGPVLDAAGNLYGATPSGGSHGLGTVFMLSPTGVFTTLYNFGGSATDGSIPNGVTLDNSGSLYGTTCSGGGSDSSGVVFKITM
jgi:uncharacterized repeat protein (TIGR03803 family)